MGFDCELLKSHFLWVCEPHVLCNLYHQWLKWVSRPFIIVHLCKTNHVIRTGSSLNYLTLQSQEGLLIHLWRDLRPKWPDHTCPRILAFKVCMICRNISWTVAKIIFNFGILFLLWSNQVSSYYIAFLLKKYFLFTYKT